MHQISLLILLFSAQFLSSLASTWPRVCPNIIKKSGWGGRTPLEIEYAIVPLQYVVVHHTVTPECSTEHECIDTMSGIQNFHMDNLEFHDIGYNFVVGGDGNVYEGAGWHKVGAHTRGYNTRSIGLAFIGNFSSKLPNAKQLKAAQDFLQCGVELGELDSRYELLGARQVSPTQSPGLRLYQELQTWKHFSRTPRTYVN